MIQVKVCGVRTPENAREIAACGVTALGLNFHPASRRFVAPELAADVAAAVRGRVEIVGVFVQQDVDATAEVARRVGLDAVQLHGDQSIAFVDRLRQRLPSSVAIWKALPVRPDVIEDVDALLEACDLAALVADAAVPGEYGGTGALADWELVRALHTTFAAQIPRFFLAGGLNPRNVAAAIRSTGVSAVDVASGVEVSPGVKSVAETLTFVQQARCVVRE